MAKLRTDEQKVRHVLRRGFPRRFAVALESSPVAPALAGLRANEARYFKNKYDHVFTVQPADEAQTTVDSKLAGTIRGSYFAFKTNY